MNVPHEQADHDPVHRHVADDSSAPPTTAVEQALEGLLCAAIGSAGIVSVSLWTRMGDGDVWRALCAVGPDSCAAGGNRAVSETVESRIHPLLDKAVTRNRAVLKRVNAAPGDPESETWCFAVPLACERFTCVLTLEGVGREDRMRALTPLVAKHRPHVEAELARYADKLLAPRADEVVIDVWIQEIANPADEPTTARRLLEASVATSGADTASVMLTGPDGALHIVASHGLPRTIAETTRVGAGEGIAGWVLATGSPVAVVDLVHSAAGRRHGITSAVSIPLDDGEAVVGVLNVGTRSAAPGWQGIVAAPLDALGRAAARSITAVRGQRQARGGSKRLLTTEEIVMRRLGTVSL